MIARHVLITGASQGIGAELARLAAADGYDLTLVARSGHALAELSDELRSRFGVSVRVAVADLAQPHAAEQLWADVVGPDGGVDMLINSAGAGLHGMLAEHDAGALRRMVELNVTALTTLTRLALPPMLQRGWGRVLNVASVVAYQPGGPGMSAYYASKAYVLALSKGVARELVGTGVSVTALCPGPTRTGFEQHSGAAGTALYRWVPGLSAAAVACKGYRGLMRGRAEVIPGLAAKLLAFAGELPPRRIALEVNRLLLGRS
ncbi:MAG: SDR family NAD(P)-dependent oxidoreductase [Gemmatimonadales bacterium]